MQPVSVFTNLLVLCLLAVAHPIAAGQSQTLVLEVDVEPLAA